MNGEKGSGYSAPGTGGGGVYAAPGAGEVGAYAAPGQTTHAVQLPGTVKPTPCILPPDEHVVVPETGQEMIDGVIVEVAPSLPPHSDRQCDIAYVIRACTAPGYIASTELLTRASADNDFATDVCVRKQGVDPATGGRYLEELSFEVKYTQTRAALTRRARMLIDRGVRRVFAIHVSKNAANVTAGPVEEWHDDGWVTRLRTDVIQDVCLIRPLQVGALLDASQADKAVVQALIERKHPALIEYATDSFDQGKRETLKETLIDLCDIFDIEVTPVMRAQIDSMGLPELHRFRDALKDRRAWPVSS